MNSVLSTSIRATLATLLLTTVAYPLTVTGLAQLLFSGPANGSLLRNDRGQVVGSELIAQSFTSAGYFQPRPSAAGPDGYDATASGGSNLGPTSAKLRDRVKDAVAKLRAENPQASAEVPAELVTTSASGLDPHLSPSAALWQVERVARARSLAPDRVRAVVEAQIEERTFGLLGEPRVNVLLLNLAMDRQFGKLSHETAN